MPAQFYMSVGSLAILDRAGPIPTVVQGAGTELKTGRGAAGKPAAQQIYCSSREKKFSLLLCLLQTPRTDRVAFGEPQRNHKDLCWKRVASHGKNTKMVRKELASPTFAPLPLGIAGMRHGHGRKRHEVDCAQSLPDARASLQPFSRPNEKPPL